VNTSRSTFRPLAWLSALVLAAVMSGCGDGIFGDDDTDTSATADQPTAAGVGTGVGGAGRGPAPVDLGDAGAFVILAESAITSVPASVVTGNVGLSPAAGTGITMTCGEVIGQTIFTVDGAGGTNPCATIDPLTTETTDKRAAYTDATGRAPDYTELGAGNIGGRNLGPATYKWGTGVLIDSNLTLTGGPNDVWIFQIAQGLTVAPGVQIILAGGALPQNIFWATFAAADFDTTSVFKGVVLSASSIVLKTGATIDGRLMANTQVALDQNRVTQP